MNALNDLFAHYNRDSRLILALFATFGCVIAGVVADKVMRERGFGVLGNGMLIMLGIGVGLGIAYSEFGPLRPSESDRIVVMATASSTMVLLICGTLKSIILSDA